MNAVLERSADRPARPDGQDASASPHLHFDRASRTWWRHPGARLDAEVDASATPDRQRGRE